MRSSLAILVLGLPAVASAGTDGRGEAGTWPRARIDFENDVLPVLTRSGCNRADCHGAALGQGGFKLSLFGSEPEADHAAITRQLSGRRIDRAEPTRSLLLRKPTRDLPHKGGRVLREESPAYRALLAWVERGFPWRESDLELRGLEARGAEAILVRALYSDGTSRDVTELALFSSNDDAIAAVDEHGRLDLRAPGATSIMVRFGGLVTAVPAAQPYAEAKVERLEERNFVDRAIGATLARDSEAFAKRVKERLLDAVERVVSVPRIGRVVREVGDERIRELLFQTFRIVYRAEPGRILVLSVLLGGLPGDRREPRRWEVQ